MKHSHDSLLKELEQHIWTPVVPLTVTAWKTKEPVPFAERTSGTQTELHPGDIWGDEVFDCAWLRFEADLPATCGDPSRLALRIDVNGELLLTDCTGRPLKGLTSRASLFADHLGRPLKSIFPRIECITDKTSTPWKLICWADAGFNDLFGSHSGDGSLVHAEVVTCRQTVRSLYYDIEVLSDLAESLPNDNKQKQSIEAAIKEVHRQFSLFSDDAIDHAKKALAPFFTGQPNRNLQISTVGHAHLDLAWLWPIRETIRKGARTFSTALHLIERYPDYIFAASQPQLFVWMKDYYPELYTRIKAAVAAGRIEPQGAAWVENDMNLPSGESIVRQLLYGRRFFDEEFGTVPDYLWLPDVFGYNGQLPQILKKSGIHYFLTQKLSWNLINRFPYHAFRWTGIDGSTVLTHMLPEDTYSSPAAPRSLVKIQNDYAQQDTSRYALLAFGIGDGGGGPGAEHLERLSRMKNIGELPHIECESTSQFLKKWATESDRFPTWSGELYLERHQGTLTTQAQTKRNNRQAELLLRELEWIALVAEHELDIPYPKNDLDRIWKEILLYQFHDILPGSSIERVYTESNTRYKALIAELHKLIDERCIGMSKGWTAFNALPWPRNDWIKTEDGWIKTLIPSMGYCTVDSRTTTIPDGLTAEPQRIENRFLKVDVTTDGTIASLYDKQNQREFSAGAINRFAIYEDHGDAWDIPLDYREKSPERALLIETGSTVDGPFAVIRQIYQYRNSRIIQHIKLREDRPLLEFETEVDWHEKRRMLRVEFPVAVTSRKASFEIQFGSLHRPTHDDTTWDKAKEEVPAHQWCDLSQEEFGVSVLNDCKYGHRIKGNLIELNLIRSAPYPDLALIAAGDQSQKSNRDNPCGDQGLHRFCYAVYPHSGDPVTACTMRQAREFNQPVRIINGPATNFPTNRSWVEVSSSQVDISAVKKAEDNHGYIIRLNNTAETSCRTEIKTATTFSCVCETNLMEEGKTKVEFPLQLQPFEIKTLRFA